MWGRGDEKSKAGWWVLLAEKKNGSQNPLEENAADLMAIQTRAAAQSAVCRAPGPLQGNRPPALTRVLRLAGQLSQPVALAVALVADAVDHFLPRLADLVEDPGVWLLTLV